jgi:hypothetical protein
MEALQSPFVHILLYHTEALQNKIKSGLRNLNQVRDRSSSRGRF